MIRVHCRTNLDLRGEEWPYELPAIPHIGDIIESKRVHKNKQGGVGFQLQLEVRAVSWKYNYLNEGWEPHIELHMTSWQRELMPIKDKSACKGSIVAFYEWYAPLVGTSVGAFI